MPLEEDADEEVPQEMDETKKENSEKEADEPSDEEDDVEDEAEEAADRHVSASRLRDLPSLKKMVMDTKKLGKLFRSLSHIQSKFSA